MVKEESKSVGQRIRLNREERGLSTQKLADQGKTLGEMMGRAATSAAEQVKPKK